MALRPATKALLNANTGQLKAALKKRKWRCKHQHSSAAGSAYENIYFSYLLHSATFPASPAVTAICPLFSHLPTLKSLRATMKSKTFHSNHPMQPFNSPEQTASNLSMLWVKNPSLHTSMTETPGASLSCSFPLPSCSERHMKSHSLGLPQVASLRYTEVR